MALPADDQGVADGQHEQQPAHGGRLVKVLPVRHASMARTVSEAIAPAKIAL